MISRSSDDDFGIDKLLVELGALSILVGGSDQGVALIFEPLPQTQFILGGSQKTGLLFGVLAALCAQSSEQLVPVPSRDDMRGYLRHRGREEPYPVSCEKRLAYVHQKLPPTETV